MEKDQEMRNIYSVKCNYDGHFIAHILEQNNMIKFNRQFFNNGELLSVDKFNYHTTLESITAELLRRNPSEEVEWIDIFDKRRPYDTFCFGIMGINSEYINELQNKQVYENISKVFNNNEDKSIGKAPIDVKIDNENGFIFLEGKIYYDNLPAFWHDLRYDGLYKVFIERQNYCINVIENNIDSLKRYIQSIIIIDMDGYCDSAESLDKTQTLLDNKIIEEEFYQTKILKIN